MKQVQAGYKKLAEKSSHFVDKLHEKLHELWLHTEGVSEGFTDLKCYNISFRNCPKILEKAHLAFVCACSNHTSVRRMEILSDR